MCRRLWSGLGIAFLLLAGDGNSADLTKIPREIRREPVYQQSPKYALIVAGPRAEQRFWLVLDGDNLYVDRNGDGDLTQLNERVTLGVTVTFDDWLLGRGSPGEIEIPIVDASTDSQN